MPKFLVDSRTLLAVRDKLGRLHDQLLGMPTVLGSFEGMLGGRALEAELDHFAGRWHYGVAEIAREITDMMGRLVGAAEAYERIENGLAGNSATGGAPPVGSGTTVIGGGGPHPNGGGHHHSSGGASGSRSKVGSGTTVIAFDEPGGMTVTEG